MMANRAWTTRLQNSIRALVPEFDHNLVYNVLHRAKNSEHALQFFRWVERAGLFNHDRETHLKIIEILGRSSKLNHARCILLDMPKKGVEWDEDMFVKLIDSYGKKGIVQESVKIFDKMKELGLERTVKSYDVLFKVILRRGRYMMAKRYFNKMLGKLAEAQNMLKEMVERYIAPKDNSIFLKLLTSQCASGDLDAAANVLKAMIRLSIPTEAGHYGVLIENFCKAEMFDRAIKLLDKLVEKEIILRPQNSVHVEASAYNPMIQHLCHNGQTGKAEIFFRQLMKTGALDPIAFNNLICGHSKEGNPDSAFEIFKIMRRREVPRDADAYKLLIESYLRKGEPADAKTALDSMIEDGHLPASSLFRSVMESLFEDGRVQTASRVMKSMVEKGVKENMDLVAKVLEALLMRGHVEEALGRIDLLMHSGCAPNFDSLLSVLSEKGKTIAALKLLDFCLERDCIVDFSSYEKVLDALLAAGKTLNAYSLLCKILAKGGATDWKSCEDLIASLNQEGNTKQADILSRMIRGGETAHGSKKGKKQSAVPS
ncbi:hypothetical protein Patl1_32110 [Pistacia atlantica]|uniref:Uncharacterized protein n=1 Tax=Pistacia atlantica TaxID=434234 RepID=A0ACC1APX5_9ROSI|nr:hypothetical protein Patl1_32110 [Pistacia atlantica]